jgi:phage tail sheath protein FI
MAGVWARTDATRGIFKAPANEALRGLVGLERQVTAAEQGELNQAGVNVIRDLPRLGPRPWGARTLSDDPEWRYLNVRRLFCNVEQSISRGTDWIVFEPNDRALWHMVKRDVTAFLMNLWRQGALMGRTADEAFFVKCDDETNPPESIDAGRLVVWVGMAPVKPAEFIVFQVSQFAGGASTEEAGNRG